MPVHRHTYIAPGVFFVQHASEGLCTLTIDHHLLTLTIAAGEKLTGYLKIIRAYYASFDNHKKIVKQYYTEITKRLTPIGPVIQPDDISTLIHQLGCISEWPRYQAPEI